MVTSPRDDTDKPCELKTMEVQTGSFRQYQSHSSEILRVGSMNEPM